LGIKDIGHNVTIHRTALFFSPQDIHIGSDVRIDCFSMLSASKEGMWIGDNVHIAAGCYLFRSSEKVVLEDFVGISARTTIFTATDDFKEGYLTGPTVPEKYRKSRSGPVTLKRHALVGAGTVILPDVVLGLAVSVGAQSLVNEDVADFSIVAGVPARMLGTRNRRILELEQEYKSEVGKP